MNDQTTLVTKALGLHQQGQFEQARALYEQALAADSDDVEALHLLGVLELQSGAAPKASELLQRARAVDPVNPQVLANLGNAFFATGRIDDAVAAFQQSLERNANSPETWAGLGNAYFALSANEQAVAAYQRALQLNATLAEVWRALASTLLTLEQPRLALSAIDNAEREFARLGHATMLPVVLTRGNVLMALGNLEEALQCFEQVVKEAPEFAHGYVSLGNICREMVQPERAQIHYLRAIELDPNGAEGHYALGLLQQDQGALDEARVSLRKALACDSRHGKAHRLLASLIRYDSNDAHLSNMREILGDIGLAKEQRKRLCFALGKALEDCGQYDDAFEHICQANRLHRESIRYSIEHDEQHIESIAEVFSETFLRKSELQSVPVPGGPKPIFIVGMPRSGTSLVEQILASHPQVYGAGELDWLDRCAREVLNDGSSVRAEDCDPLSQLATANAATIREIGDAYLSRVQALSPDSGWIVDKMPANYLHLGLIHLALPHAVIIHCQRNSVATCWSVFKNFLGTRGHAYSFDQLELGRYYRLYQQLMTHWNTVMPGAIHGVKYEELVVDQETVSRQLLHDCGIAWDDDCLNFHATRRPVRTLSASQVRRPIYADARSGSTMPRVWSL